jgi:hypothetical protein
VEVDFHNLKLWYLNFDTCCYFYDEFYIVRIFYVLQGSLPTDAIISKYTRGKMLCPPCSPGGDKLGVNYNF